MFEPWSIAGKNGNIQFSKGEVVYQTRGVVVETIYQDLNGIRYIWADDELQEVTTNPFNGYCYRQDGL